MYATDKGSCEEWRGFDMGKSLVAYFSATGNTKKIAERIAEAAEADIFEIVPAEPYSEADLDWHDRESRSSLEMADPSCRPAFVGGVEDMDAYKVVYLGFPIWWYIEPRIIATFLDAYDFSGKIIVPFATSGGSQMGRAPEDIQGLCPGAKVKGARVFRLNDDNAVLYQWISPFTH